MTIKHLAITLLAATMLLAAPCARAATWYVDVDNPGGSGTAADPFGSIRQALGVAGGSDQIHIADGAYNDAVEAFSTNGQLNVTSNLKFYGGYAGLSGGASAWTARTSRSTVIDAENHSRIFDMTADNAPLIDGFTLQNGNAGGGSGGAIVTTGGFSQGGVAVNDVLFQNNSAASGGALSVNANYSTVTVSNSDFVSNSASNGGAFNAGGNNGTATFTGVTMTANTASSNGGAMNVGGGCPVTFTSSTLADNLAGSQGGVANVNGGDLTLNQSKMTGNSANTTSGIYAYTFATSRVRLTNVLVADNTSNGGNGYVFELGTNQPGSLLKLDFITAADNSGAGVVYLHDKDGDNNEQLLLTNSILYGDGSGTGVKLSHAPNLTMDYNDVYNFATLYDNATAGANSISADPLLDAAYKLLAGSAAIDAADPTSTVTVDLAGDPRPQGSAPDMGAYEVVPEPASLALLGLGGLAALRRRRRA